MSVAMGIPQPPAVGQPGVEGEVDRRRHQHAAHGGADGPQGLAGLRQLTHEQLALDLQPHHEEEDRHEAVVDPVVQVEGDPVLAQVQAEGLVDQALVGLRPGGIGPDEGDEGEEEQHDPARDRLTGEELERPQQPLRHLLPRGGRHGVLEPDDLRCIAVASCHPFTP
jgi:hypothetical protein